jgi:hypothetical protein
MRYSIQIHCKAGSYPKMTPSRTQPTSKRNSHAFQQIKDTAYTDRRMTQLQMTISETRMSPLHEQSISHPGEAYDFVAPAYLICCSPTVMPFPMRCHRARQWLLLGRRACDCLPFDRHGCSNGPSTVLKRRTHIFGRESEICPNKLMALHASRESEICPKKLMALHASRESEICPARHRRFSGGNRDDTTRRVSICWLASQIQGRGHVIRCRRKTPRAIVAAFRWPSDPTALPARRHETRIDTVEAVLNSLAEKACLRTASIHTMKRSCCGLD